VVESQESVTSLQSEQSSKNTQNIIDSVDNASPVGFINGHQNLKGMGIATLVSESQPAGPHRAVWNGRNASGQPVAAGFYIYKLNAGSSQAVKRMIYLR